MNMSFRLKSTLAVASIQILILVGLLFLSLYYLKTTNDRSFSERYDAEVAALSVLVREAVLTSDIAVLEDMGAHFMNKSNAVYLKIYDNQNLLSEQSIPNKSVLAGASDTSLAAVTDGVLDLKKVIYASNFAIGKIEIGYSIAEYESLIHDAEYTLGIFAIFGLIIVVIVSWFLGALLTGELNNFRQALLRIERGFIDQLPVAAKSSEFKTLSVAFNQMSSSLQLRQEERDRAELGLIKAKEHAEKASDSKTEFMSHITHEIRSPLNGLLGCVDLLSETDLDKQQRVYIQTAQQSSKSLLSLVNNFLDISRIESGVIELSDNQFDLVKMCEAILTSKCLQTQDKAVELCLFVDPSVPHVCFGDEDRIRQVLVNLLDNAVKFTRSGGVAIELFSADVKDATFNLVCHVRDSGIGIPKTKQVIIFDEFTQVDNSDATLHGGAGLGLSICKHLVTIMQGKIALDSTVHEGTTFTISLPLRYVKPPAKLTQLVSNIVIFSKNTVLTTTLKKQLESWGGSVSCCSDVHDNTELDFAKFVFLDLNISQDPQLQRRLNKLQKNGGKVILLSHEFVGLEEGGKPLDCADIILNKPIKVTMLAEIMAIDPSATSRDSMPGLDNKSELKTGMVLLAEDSLTNQLVATAMLEKEGYTVTVSNDGYEVLAKLEEKTFDVILMDIRMPRMDGIETAKKIRATGSDYQSIPIIALTANPLQNEQENCKKAGMNGFVSKPIQKTELIDAIETCLSQGKANKKEIDLSELNQLGMMDEKTLQRLVQETSEEMVERMIAVFVKEVQRRFNAMKEGLITFDLESIETEAHTLKSNAATFGALKLAELAKIIESACKRMDETMVRSIFAETEQVLLETLVLYKARYKISDF